MRERDADRESKKIIRRRPCESMRKQGPIHRAVYVWYEGKHLPQQLAPVAMGPCFRRDDANVFWWLGVQHHIQRALHDRFQIPARYVGPGADRNGVDGRGRKL